MNLAALLHRPESEDCFLYTDEAMRVRFHTARADVAKVTVLYGDPYWQLPEKLFEVSIDEQAGSL